MRILFLIAVLLAAGVTQASAAWKRIGETSDAQSYADFSTIERTGSTARVTVMSDYHDEQSWNGFSFFSSWAMFEYDCETPRSRVIQEHGFTGHMATGTITYKIEAPRQWQPVNKGTISETRRDLACGFADRDSTTGKSPSGNSSSGTQPTRNSTGNSSSGTQPTRNATGGDNTTNDIQPARR
jgi:hypothetical protein